jgi:hypothetical protein
MAPKMGPASAVSNLATGAVNALKCNHLQDFVPNANKRQAGRGIVLSLRKEGREPGAGGSCL